MAEQEQQLVVEEEVKEGKIDQLERLFGTIDSSTLIALTVLIGGIGMMIAALMYVPDQFKTVAVIALALIGAFTGVHIGVKASLNSVNASSEWMEFFKPFVPILELIASKVEEFANEPDKPQPPTG